jgi:glycosyltransferase involved in cell wall biosynthesis
MRSIQVIPAIERESSGPSYSVKRLAQSLEDAGCATTIAAMRMPGSDGAVEGVRKFPMDRGPLRLGRCTAMRRWLVEECREGRAQVLHNHGMWQMNSLYSASVGPRFKVPVVQSPRGALSSWALRSGSWTKRIFWPTLQRPALARTSCFHATAESEAMDVRACGFKQPVAVIPNGIDLPPREALSTTRARAVLFLGRLHPVKGIPLLLEAWRSVQDRFDGWELRIAGSDDGYYGNSGYRKELEGRAEELACARVRFLGEVRGEAKWRLLSECAVFVLPSQSENFGIAVAEALAAGTPSIVTHGAPWSGLAGARAGWWVEYRAESVASALEQAMSLDLSTLQAMGDNGRAWMERDFSWSSVADRTLATYRWLCEGGTRPSWVQE